MKYFYQISKILLYCIIGGILGFIVMFIGSYMKANSIANDIARSGLLLATQEGCINFSAASRFCQEMHDAYGYEPGNGNTRSILVSNCVKTSTEEDKPSDIRMYLALSDANTAEYGLISVHPNHNSSINLINTYDNDYVNHVQRGQVITVNATVEANLYFNWVFGANANYASTHSGVSEGDGRNELRFVFPVNASATGVSCKWYKGEDGGLIT